MQVRLNRFSEKVSKNIKNSEDRLMNKNVVVISTSIRANSNSEVLAKSFADGASYAGNKVEYRNGICGTWAEMLGCFSSALIGLELDLFKNLCIINFIRYNIFN